MSYREEINDYNQIISIIEQNTDIHFVSNKSLALGKEAPIFVGRKTSKEDYCIIKILTKDQASLYQHLLSIRNPHLETIYDVNYIDGIFFSVNEFVHRPSSIEYKLYDAMHPTNFDLDIRSLSLNEYIDSYDVLKDIHLSVNTNKNISNNNVPTENMPFNQTAPSEHFYIPENIAIRLIIDIIDGLEVLSKYGLVHGDLSPQNILLTDINSNSNTFSCKIIDYGTIRPFKPEDHPVTQVVGTKEFAAPEILAYNIPNDRIDIYSLGCLLHYMILGISPSEKGLEHSKNLLSPGVYSIIKYCNEEYSTRYSSLRQLKKELLYELKALENPEKKINTFVPGFRTGKAWKMAIASFFYLVTLLQLISDILTKHINYHVILYYLLVLAEIIFVCDVFRIRKKLPDYYGFSKKHPVVRVFVKLTLAIIIFIIYLILFYLKE